jgi:hypothetical protein
MLARPIPFARFETARARDPRADARASARSSPRWELAPPEPAIDRHSTILPVALRTPMDRQALDPPELWCQGADIDFDLLEDDFEPSRDTEPVPPDEHDLPTVRP